MTKRIDWTEIYSYFISSEILSLKDAAAKFHVSYDVLRQKASSEHWTQKKKTTWQNSIKIVEEKTGMKIAEHKEQNIFIAQALLFRAAKALASGKLPTNARDIQKWIKTGVAIERDALGMNSYTNAYAVFRTEEELTSFVARIVEAVTGGKQVKITSSKTSDKAKDKVLPDGTSSNHKSDD